MGSKFMFVLISTLIVTSDSYPFHHIIDRNYRYPDTCCQLEWNNFTGGRLPAYYVVAGSFMDRNWAYVLNGGLSLTFKPDSSSEDIDCNESSPCPVLTNPNLCHIDWYTTRFPAEDPPQNEDWYFPVVNEHKGYFARTLDGKPASLSWTLYFPTSATEYAFDDSINYQIMYVDCKESILIMSQAKLSNIIYNQRAFKKLQSSAVHVQYKNLTMTNNSGRVYFVVLRF